MDGEELLKQGQKLREQGKTFEALDAINKSLQFFAREQKYGRFAHALLDRAICWQHLYQSENNDFGFAILYKKDAEAMLEIVKAKKIEEELPQAYFINGKAEMLFDNFDKAIEFYNSALEKIKRNAQKGDWLTNLGKALYLNGEKQKGIETILDGIAQIKKYATEIDQYTTNVWISGGYLRLAEILKTDNPNQSAEYLSKAKAIIDADPTQIVRKKQLENFLKTSKTGL